MRITGADSAADPNSNVDANAPSKQEKDGTSAFAKALSKKQQTSQDNAQSAAGKSLNSESAISSLLGEPEPVQNPMDASSVEDKHLVSLPPQLQDLVREVAVVVNAPGQQQVHIDLNSNVLKGLHIRIDRQDGAVAIQFQSSSDEIARLLSKNTGALADALIERGVDLKDIRINGPEKADDRQDYKNRFSGRGSWQSSGRQGKR